MSSLTFNNKLVISAVVVGFMFASVVIQLRRQSVSVAHPLLDIQSLNTTDRPVLVLIPGYGQPTFLDLQVRALRRFMLSPFVVVTYIPSETDTVPWRTACDQLNVTLVRIDANESDRDLYSSWNSMRLGAAMDWMWANVQSFPGYVLVLDMDMIPVHSVNVQELLHGGSSIAARTEQRGDIYYLYNGVMVFDIQQMPNPSDLSMKPGNINGDRYGWNVILLPQPVQPEAYRDINPSAGYCDQRNTRSV